MSKASVKLIGRSDKPSYTESEPISIIARVINYLEHPIYVVTNVFHLNWEQDHNILHISVAVHNYSGDSAFFTIPRLETVNSKDATEIEITINFPVRQLNPGSHDTAMAGVKEINPKGKIKVSVSVAYGITPFNIPKEVHNLRKVFADWQYLAKSSLITIERT